MEYYMERTKYGWIELIAKDGDRIAGKATLVSTSNGAYAGKYWNAILEVPMRATTTEHISGTYSEEQAITMACVALEEEINRGGSF